MSDFMNYSNTSLSFEDLYALYYKATHDPKINKFDLRANLTKVKNFVDRNEIELANIIGCIIGIAARDIITRKWNFEKHSNLANFVFALGIDKKQAKQACMIIVILKMVTMGVDVASIIDNEMNKNKGEIA